MSPQRYFNPRLFLEFDDDDLFQGDVYTLNFLRYQLAEAVPITRHSKAEKSILFDQYGPDQRSKCTLRVEPQN
jgi:hypothetical protein